VLVLSAQGAMAAPGGALVGLRGVAAVEVARWRRHGRFRGSIGKGYTAATGEGVRRRVTAMSLVRLRRQRLRRH